MWWIMAALFFIYGLFIGSFLNVCIYRIPEGKSVIYPPSACGSCGHKLSFVDMLPILNYIVYKGKCRYCDANYSIQYPLIELLNGVLYFFIYARCALTVYTIIYCVLISLLLIASVIDLKYMIIPNSINIFGAILGLILLINDKSNILDKLIGLLIGYGLFMLINLTTGAMGGGDIKLMAVLGLIFGVKGVLFVSILSFILGAAISVLLIVKKIKSRKDKIPFGPFISMAALLYILHGQEIISLYLEII